jgi:hypothetical protein
MRWTSVAAGGLGALTLVAPLGAAAPAAAGPARAGAVVPLSSAPAWGPDCPVAHVPSARSTRGGTTFLHALPALAQGWGPVTYTRSSDDGRTWTQPRRLTRAGERAYADPRAATAGSRVYVAWSRWSRARDAPDAVLLRVNRSYGDPAAWGRPVRLPVITSLRAVAATGATVAVTGWRGSASYVVVSQDAGRTWTARRVAAGGLTPTVAASGRTVALARAERGSAEVRVSLDRGRTWQPWRRLGTATTGVQVSLAVLRDRVVVTGGTGDGGRAWVRTRESGRWGRASVLPTPASTGTVRPLLALRGSDGVGVLWSWRSSRLADEGWTFDNQVLWLQSADGGRTWARPVQVSTEAGANEATSVLWRSDGTLYASWVRHLRPTGVDQPSIAVPHLRVRR